MSDTVKDCLDHKIKEAQQRHWEAVRPTYVEQWDSRLYNASIVTRTWPLARKHAAALVAAYYANPDEGTPPAHRRALRELADLLTERIAEFPHGAFVRLGSRSPKDNPPWDRPDARVWNGEQAIEQLAGSERVSDDLQLAAHHGYTPHIVLREWLDLKPWQEWRCFVRSGAILGISQYFYHDPLMAGSAAPMPDLDALAWAIGVFIGTINRWLPVKECIVDVIVHPLPLRGAEALGNRTLWGVRLLEVNPWFSLTDPCCFNWSREDWAVPELRWVDAEGNVQARRIGP